MGNQGGELGGGGCQEKWCQTGLRFVLWEPLKIRVIELHRLLFKQTHNKITTRRPLWTNMDAEARHLPAHGGANFLNPWQREEYFSSLLGKGVSQWNSDKVDMTYLSDLVQAASDLCPGHQIWPVLPGRCLEVQEVGTCSCPCLHSGWSKTSKSKTFS